MLEDARIGIAGHAPNRRMLAKPVRKAARAGALLARRLAKAVVLWGVARRRLATLAIFPGDTAFRAVSVVDEEGRCLDPQR